MRRRRFTREKRADRVFSHFHPWRSFYEHSFNATERLTVELDVIADRYTQDILTGSPRLSLDELSEIQQQARADLHNIAATANGNWVDLYCFRTKIDFLEPLAVLPAVLQLPGENAAAIAEHLSSDLYGYSGDILTDALATYDVAWRNPLFTEEVTNELRGVISEHTFLALVNKSGDRTTIALPGTTFDDKKGKTDAYYYHTERPGAVLKMPAQVKTRRSESNYRPDGISFVYMEDYQSPISLEVSRAIVNDVAGRSSEREAALIGNRSEAVLHFLQTELPLNGRPLRA